MLDAAHFFTAIFGFLVLILQRAWWREDSPTRLVEGGQIDRYQRSIQLDMIEENCELAVPGPTPRDFVLYRGGREES